MKTIMTEFKAEIKNLTLVNNIFNILSIVLLILMVLNISMGYYNPSYFFIILYVFVFTLPNFLYPVIIKPFLIKKNIFNENYDKINSFFLILSILFLVFLLSFIIFNTASSKTSLPKDNKEDVTIIVLGSGIRNGKPMTNLQKRLDIAGEYMQENPNANCIVSGGYSQSGGDFESSVMRNYLMEKYTIDEKRIFEENKSTDTHENLLFSYDIAKENSLNTDIIIATNDYHMFRSGLFAKYAGFDTVYSLPVKTNPIVLTQFWFREILSMVKALIIINI